MHPCVLCGQAYPGLRQALLVVRVHVHVPAKVPDKYRPAPALLLASYPGYLLTSIALGLYSLSISTVIIQLETKTAWKDSMHSKKHYFLSVIPNVPLSSFQKIA